MKRIIFSLFILLCARWCSAQSTHDILLGGGLDLLKTDNKELFKKTQVGVEANYFVVRHFSVGAGGEIWSTGQKSSFVMGVRWYANENIFVRFRGLIGANDAAIGGGYAWALNKALRAEAMGDYYLSSQKFGIRAGLSYVIRR
ncbi:MAG: hypothetical protein K1X47_14820 [Cyclobacteriaceae bacterium]|nr:hypothetical protein [Cyclobacteriaceae bacterium]